MFANCLNRHIIDMTDWNLMEKMSAKLIDLICPLSGIPLGQV